MAEGRRERVRERIAKCGFTGFFPHEILEYMLFPFIPRKDTNPIAHELIARFGGLYGVFNASYDDILEISGMTEGAALFLSSYKKLEAAIADASAKDILKLRTMDDCSSLALLNHRETSVEECYIVCFDAYYRILLNERLQRGDETGINIDTKRLARIIAGAECKKVIFTHNHTTADAKPSVSDIKFTSSLLKLCISLGVDLIDHMIVTSNKKVFSFRDTGLLNDVYNAVTKMG